MEKLYAKGRELGGAVSGVFAARYPDRIRSLTALAASGLGRPVPRVFVEDHFVAVNTYFFDPTAKILVPEPAEAAQRIGQHVGLEGALAFERDVPELGTASSLVWVALDGRLWPDVRAAIL